METGGMMMNIGGLLDDINDASGPGVFNFVDLQAADYATANFPGC
jgi:hypothetical protein